MPPAPPAAQGQAALPLHTRERVHPERLQSNLVVRFRVPEVVLSQTTRVPLPNARVGGQLSPNRHIERSFLLSGLLFRQVAAPRGNTSLPYHSLFDYVRVPPNC